LLNEWSILIEALGLLGEINQKVVIAGIVVLK
jgi:hypothetical protein